MYQAATESFKNSDVAILCAAVADFRPETQATEKIKRESLPPSPSKERGSLELRLVPNPDIAAALGQMKQKGQVLVGFALETNDEEQNAKKKLEKKNLDFIVLNSLQNKGTCFQSDENQISIISHNGKKDYEKKSKQEVARDIISEIFQFLK
jgi:phosphopantothenoylcysteine decarboxylase/phosphopantothenate--cysteine ligase